ncbi:hypothetical protein PFISCL1PPCAC_17654, partial [Pristionchus fissidentatus]
VACLLASLPLFPLPGRGHPTCRGFSILIQYFDFPFDFGHTESMLRLLKIPFDGSIVQNLTIHVISHRPEEELSPNLENFFSCLTVDKLVLLTRNLGSSYRNRHLSIVEKVKPVGVTLALQHPCKFCAEILVKLADLVSVISVRGATGGYDIIAAHVVAALTVSKRCNTIRIEDGYI